MPAAPGGGAPSRPAAERERRHPHRPKPTAPAQLFHEKYPAQPDFFIANPVMKFHWLNKVIARKSHPAVQHHSMIIRNINRKLQNPNIIRNTYAHEYLRYRWGGMPHKQ
ncbi:hypothetical protein [Azospirillum argentinense]